MCRPHSKANRAGTRGFRAPEVLLKCGDQCGGKVINLYYVNHPSSMLSSLAVASVLTHIKPAIDVWAAGMILLFFLVGKFPLFQSNDDIEALMEIAAVLGRKKMEKAATLHSACNSGPYSSAYNAHMQVGRSRPMCHPSHKMECHGENSSRTRIQN